MDPIETEETRVTYTPYIQFSLLQRPVEPVKPPIPQQVFDYQVETLVAKGLAKYDDADKFRSGLPTGAFIFVPAQPTLDTDTLSRVMSMIVVEGYTGENYLNGGAITDEIVLPTTAHLMVDVEDGHARQRLLPRESLSGIIAEGRQPYNVWRGLIHCVLYPETLKHCYLDLVASRYQSKKWPRLFPVSRAGRHALDAKSGDFLYSCWAAPSCGSVICG